MKQPEMNTENFGKWPHTISLRTLKKSLESYQNASLRWTPYESIPVSFSREEVGRAEPVKLAH